MAKLIYATIASLDGYDRQGRLLPDVGDGVEREDEDRARLRRGGDRSDEGRGGARHLHRRSRPAAQAFDAGLVDECHLFIAPVLVGGGKRSLPDGVHLKLDLLEQRRFGNGMSLLSLAARR